MGRRGPRWRWVIGARCPCPTCVFVQAPLYTALVCQVLVGGGGGGHLSADISAVVVQLDAVIFQVNTYVLYQLDDSLLTGMERISVQRLTWRPCVGGESVCVVHQDHTFTGADGGQGCVGDSHGLSQGVMAGRRNDGRHYELAAGKHSLQQSD